MSRGRHSDSKLIIVPVDTDLQWQSAASRPPSGLLPMRTYKAAKNALNSAIANNENFVPMSSPDQAANRTKIAGVLARVLTSENSARRRSRNPLSYMIGITSERETANELYDTAMDASRWVMHSAEKSKTIVVVYRNSDDQYKSGRIWDNEVDENEQAGDEERAANAQDITASTSAVDNCADLSDHPTQKLVTVLSAEPLSDDVDYTPSPEGVWSMVDARAFISPFTVEPAVQHQVGPLAENRNKALPSLPVMPIPFESDPGPSVSGSRNRYTIESTNLSIPSSAPPEYRSSHGTLMAIDDVDETDVRVDGASVRIDETPGSIDETPSRIVPESRTGTRVPLARARTAPNMRNNPGWL